MNYLLIAFELFSCFCKRRYTILLSIDFILRISKLGDVLFIKFLFLIMMIIINIIVIGSRSTTLE